MKCSFYWPLSGMADARTRANGLIASDLAATQCMVALVLQMVALVM